MWIAWLSSSQGTLRVFPRFMNCIHSIYILAQRVNVRDPHMFPLFGSQSVSINSQRSFIAFPLFYRKRCSCPFKKLVSDSRELNVKARWNISTNWIIPSIVDRLIVIVEHKSRQMPLLLYPWRIGGKERKVKDSINY